MTGTLLVTSNLVIGETHTLLRTAKGYREAKRFLDALGYSRKMERLFITEYLERKAHEISMRTTLSVSWMGRALPYCVSNACNMLLPSTLTS